MSLLPWLHHHDITTIVGLFMHRQYVIYIIRTVRTLHNVGALKVANLHCSRQQCVVAEWSGRSVGVHAKRLPLIVVIEHSNKRSK